MRQTVVTFAPTEVQYPDWERPSTRHGSRSGTSSSGGSGGQQQQKQQQQQDRLLTPNGTENGSSSSQRMDIWTRPAEGLHIARVAVNQHQQMFPTLSEEEQNSGESAGEDSHRFSKTRQDFSARLQQLAANKRNQLQQSLSNTIVSASADDRSPSFVPVPKKRTTESAEDEADRLIAELSAARSANAASANNSVLRNTRSPRPILTPQKTVPNPVKKSTDSEQLLLEKDMTELKTEILPKETNGSLTSSAKKGATENSKSSSSSTSSDTTSGTSSDLSVANLSPAPGELATKKASTEEEEKREASSSQSSSSSSSGSGSRPEKHSPQRSAEIETAQNQQKPSSASSSSTSSSSGSSSSTSKTTSSSSGTGSGGAKRRVNNENGRKSDEQKSSPKAMMNGPVLKLPPIASSMVPDLAEHIQKRTTMGTTVTPFSKKQQISSTISEDDRQRFFERQKSQSSLPPPPPSKVPLGFGSSSNRTFALTTDRYFLNRQPVPRSSTAQNRSSSASFGGALQRQYSSAGNDTDEAGKKQQSAAFQRWLRQKLADERERKRKQAEKEEHERQEKEEKRAIAEKNFQLWKREQDEKLAKKFANLKRKALKKLEHEKQEKEERRVAAEKSFEHWSKAQVEKQREQKKRAQSAESNRKKRTEKEKERRLEEAQNSFEQWIQNAEERIKLSKEREQAIKSANQEREEEIREKRRQIAQEAYELWSKLKEEEHRFHESLAFKIVEFEREAARRWPRPWIPVGSSGPPESGGWHPPRNGRRRTLEPKRTLPFSRSHSTSFVEPSRRKVGINNNQQKQGQKNAPNKKACL